MAKDISLSPDRHTFQKRKYLERVALNPNDEDAKSFLDFYQKWAEDDRLKMQDHEWQKNSMEYDLLTTDWILEKVRTREEYAQNLYAAMCNREFQKNDVWPVLKDERWSCSWRHAGGVIADMRRKGDYIDWYCSGILNEASDEEYQSYTKEAQERYLFIKNNFVAESVVTDEIRADLLKLGWIVIDEA